MKKRFQHAIAATALLALGFAGVVPARAGVDADKITTYIETARGVFGGDKTAAAAVSEALAGSADKATVGEIAATLSAVEVAKNDPALLDALAAIVSAVGDEASDFADCAAATVSVVTGKNVASALSDPALADAAKNPNSVLAATEKADLKDLYRKVLAALKGSGYTMKGDGDKSSLSGKGNGKGKTDKDGKTASSGSSAKDGGSSAKDGGSSAKDGGASAKDGGSSAKDGGASAKDGGSSAKDGGASAAARDGDAKGFIEPIVYDDDENLGDPLDQTRDDPYELRVPPTTLSGYMPPVVTPVVSVAEPSTKPKPSKPRPAEPEPLEEPVIIPTGGEKPWVPTPPEPPVTTVGL